MQPRRYLQGKDAMTDRTKRWISRATTALSAASVGMLLVQLALNWITICGSSAYSLTMAVLAVAVSLVTASALPAWSSNKALSICGLIVIACSTIAADAIDSMLTISSGWATTSIAMGFALPAAFAVLPVLSILCWARAIMVRTNVEASSTLSLSESVCAACLGFASIALMFAHAAFNFPAFVLPVAFCVVGTVLSLRFHHSTQATSVAASNATASKPVGSNTDTGQPIGISETIMALSSGLILHAAYRLFGSLFPVNILSVNASIVLVVLTIALITWLPLKKTAFQVIAVLALLCPVAFYGTLADGNLWINASVSQVWLITVLRSLQPAAIVVTLWALFRSTALVRSSTLVGFGTLAPSAETSQDVAQDQIAADGHVFNSTTFKLFAFVCCGLTVGLMSVAFGSNVRFEWMIGMALLSLSALYRQPKAQGQSRGLLLPASMAGTVCLLLLVCRLPTSETSHLLFTGRSAIAYRDGLNRNVIEESNSHRLIEEYSTAAGEITVWRTQGDRIEVRIDGYPSGQLSDNVVTSPVPQADALSTILPLVMHDRPGSVMLMGDDVGVGVKICQNFPIPTVRAFQSDPQMGDIASRYLWKEDRTELNKDPRFEIQNMPIPLAIRQQAPEGGFDVIISASPNPILGQRLPELNRQYYRRIRSLMTDDGVYCQRVSQYDLGSKSMVRLISTIRSEFPKAVVIQTVPGELVVVATCAERKLLDKALLSRLQKVHVKKQLALSGLDWSQVASLPVIQTNGVYSLFEHLPQTPAESYRSSQLAFSLPLEACRWADKATELKVAFAPHQLRIADAAPKSKSYAEYARRFTAVIQEGEIVTAFPDNPWTYRKSLKMEMQRNPRPPIENYVDGKVVRTTDPADQLRKDYFIQLGTLLNQAKMGFTNPVDVRKFQNIIANHEPLLTWFAHHELVRIFEATGGLSPAQELRSRLYTINFASVADPGVQQITAALEQLVQQPKLIPEAGRRYDHANGLLQELIRRWELRRNYDPTSAAQAQIDVDRCVRVARKTLEAMETWAPEVNIDKDRFAARRRFVHHSLVIPLRKYSDLVLAHRMKTDAPNLAEQEWTPDDTSFQGDELPILMSPSSAATN